MDRNLGVRTQEGLVIENSPARVRAALAADMAVVAVTTEQTRSEFRGAEALDSRWVVDCAQVLTDVVYRRIDAVETRKSK